MDRQSRHQMTYTRQRAEVLMTGVRTDTSFHWNTPHCIWIIIRFAHGRMSTRLSLHVTVICQRFDPNNSLVPFSGYLPKHSLHEGTHCSPNSQIFFILGICFRRWIGKITSWVSCLAPEEGFHSFEANQSCNENNVQVQKIYLGKEASLSLKHRDMQEFLSPEQTGSGFDEHHLVLKTLQWYQTKAGILQN